MPSCITETFINATNLSLLALNFAFERLPDGTSISPPPPSLHDAATFPGLTGLNLATLPGALPAVPEPATAAPRTRPKTTPHPHQP